MNRCILVFCRLIAIVILSAKLGDYRISTGKKTHLETGMLRCTQNGVVMSITVVINVRVAHRSIWFWNNFPVSTQSTYTSRPTFFDFIKKINQYKKKVYNFY